MATVYSNVSKWHTHPTMDVQSGVLSAWDDGNGYIAAEWTVETRRHSGGFLYSPLYIQATIVIDGVAHHASEYGYPSGTSGNGPWKSISLSLTGRSRIYVGDGNHTVYGAINCRDNDHTQCSATGGPYTDVRCTDNININIVTETGPYDPYDLTIKYENNTIKTAWKDNLGTSTKQYDRMDIYVDGVRVYWENDDNCEAWASYNVSPGSKIQFCVYTHSTSNKNSGTTWSGVYTVPGSINPSGSVNLVCESKDSNMHVRGSYQVKATWNASGFLVSNPYSVNLWFYDNANPQHTSSNNASNIGNTSRTHAVIPYNMGSRNLNVLRAKVQVYVKTYYYTPNQDAPATYHTKSTLIGEKDILIGTLIQFYVKMITTTTNRWCRGYVIQSGQGKKLVPYEKFKIK